MKKIGCLILMIAALAQAVPTAARLAGAYYGTNYTVPFAHAYRALGTLGVDRRQAIDRDVYHMARLGFNAFRLHLWDVELSNAEGDLIQNEHLDLLDYLIARLEERNIAVILTAQTNFGNGYPERNINNGAFSYNFEKCRVHDDAEAQRIQARYLTALAQHVNPYTGKSYADDPAIMAVEINNEPCHSGTHDEITAYVDGMAEALRGAGWNKDILYNVSHNLWRTSAFYRADIDGTTYQWYPTGLVRGSERKGNFLPVLDSYDIPFDTVPGYAEQPKLIYEYDPADVLDTYLYPAAARTFRKAGFDWVTQFAYDPIDMARFNTEYQTHFLNLAYTPGKAIGMAIAAEVMRRTPIGKDYGKYPVDTVFGDFTVSARRNLAMFNSGEHYYHTNNTTDAPKAPARLRSIAGTGSSPLVTTDGTGAYFADKLDKNTWRLEILPDVELTADPFARPSLHREVAVITDAPVTMTLNLPGLPENFSFEGERGSGKADGFTAKLMPGVYLLGADSKKFAAWTPERVYNSEHNLKTGEYVMPPVSEAAGTIVLHTPRHRVAPGATLPVVARIAGSVAPDSVFVYPADADFWRSDNRLHRMTSCGKNTYTADIDLKGKRERFDYAIVVFAGGSATTFPSGEAGTPLDWDFGAGRASARPESYSTLIEGADAPVVLLDARAGLDGAEFSSIPETWRTTGIKHVGGTPDTAGALRLYRKGDDRAPENISVSKYVGHIMADRADTRASEIRLHVCRAEGIDSVNVGLVTRDGFTYAATVPVTAGTTSVASLYTLAAAPTLLNPAPYPSFLQRKFMPDMASVPPFKASDIESVTVYTDSVPQEFTLDISGIWLE